MEAQKLPVTHDTEPQERSQRKGKNNGFTKLQAFLILFATLIISLGAGYYISDNYLWSTKDEGRINEQLEYYKALVDAEPNNPEHRVNLGYTYFLKDDNGNAIKQLKMATDLDNKYFGAYFNLGLVYLDEKRYNDALKQSLKTVELGPKNFKAHLLNGMVYRELKMYKDADESLKEALKLVPTNTDIINEIGRVAEDQGQYKEAEQFFKEALAYDPLYKPATEGLDRVSDKIKK